MIKSDTPKKQVRPSFSTCGYFFSVSVSILDTKLIGFFEASGICVTTQPRCHEQMHHKLKQWDALGQNVLEFVKTIATSLKL